MEKLQIPTIVFSAAAVVIGLYLMNKIVQFVF
jgi:hypothetical protein